MSGNHFPVDQKLEFATNILPDTAESDLSFGNVTVPSARRTADPRVREWLIQLSLFDHVRLVYWAKHNFSTNDGPCDPRSIRLKSLSLPAIR